VVLSLAASYLVAMTVVPLFCARFIKAPAHHGTPSNEREVTVDHPRSRRNLGDRFNIWFNNRFEGFLRFYDRLLGAALRRPILTLSVFAVAFVASLGAFPQLGLSFFPRTDSGQGTSSVQAHLLAEVVATLGLLLVIFSLARTRRGSIAPAAVGAYIGAAYFFTSSTGFANPAISVGRMLSDTFAGIAPASVPAFVVAQLVGGAVAIGVLRILYPDITPDEAAEVMVPHEEPSPAA
jgi:arsenate reductase